MRCYACHQLNSATARFCIECGAALSAPSVQPPAANPAVASASYAIPQAAPVVPAYGAGQYPASQNMPDGFAVPYAVPPAQPAAFAQPGYAVPQAPAAPASMVNNVTVTHAQVATTPVVRPRRPASVSRTTSTAAIVLGALYFLASGGAVGALWFAMLRPYYYTSPAGYILAIVLTLVVLFSDIIILDRMNR